MADGKRIRFLRSTWEGGLGQKAEYLELDLATGTESRIAQTAAEQVSDKGDTWEVGTTWDGQVWIRGLSDGQRRVIAQGGYYPLLMNNESKVAYAGQYARGLWLIDIDGSNRRQLVSHPGYILMQPRSHSGSKVVFIVDSLDGKAREMWEVDTESNTSQLLTRTD